MSFVLSDKGDSARRHRASDAVDSDGKIFTLQKVATTVKQTLDSIHRSENQQQIEDNRTDEEKRKDVFLNAEKNNTGKDVVKTELGNFDAVKDPIDTVIRCLESNAKDGLTSQVAAKHFAIYGPNELAKDPPTPLWKMFLGQFTDLLVMMLIAASIVSMALGEYPAAITIIFIIMANAILGVVQEHRAGQAIDALESLSAPKTQVRREGQVKIIDSVELVPGDIVELETGQKISADIRLITTVDLQSLESALTGEPEGVKKFADLELDGKHEKKKEEKEEKKKEEKGEKKEEALTSKNMVYMGCSIQAGRGTGIVVKTGMQTKMGEVANLLQSAEKGMSPLQQKLHNLGVRLGIASISVSIIVFVVGVGANRGIDPDNSNPAWLQMLLVAVSLTVAAVPEGLPACVTITLAVGMRRMVQKNALVRNLHSVETLGSATVICTDKTGTLTKGEMTAKKLWFRFDTFDITGEGYNPTGYIIPLNHPKSEAKQASEALFAHNPDIIQPLLAACLCSNAAVQRNEKGEWEAVNNPSERPLVVAAYKGQVLKSNIDADFKREKENPFNSHRKMMSVLVNFENKNQNPFGNFIQKHHDKPTHVAFVKGAPNIILEKSVSILDKDHNGATIVRPMQNVDAENILQVIDKFSESAFRVLAVSYQPFKAKPLDDDSTLERNLVFVGLFASIDPERAEVEPAINKARNAGIRTVMITGDYVKTAKAIAKNIKLLPEGAPDNKAIDCEVIRELDNAIKQNEAILKSAQTEKRSELIKEAQNKIKELESKLDKVTAEADVYARAKPVDKITIVRSLQRQGHVCSMTGDGVNDAPALKQANIGVAMGITGTDVAKASSDMILTDDNFASIVAAVEEGRTIYANISKFVYFLLSTNVSEVFLILICILIGLQSPLEPIQILWMNLVTDGLPAIALAIEKIEPGVMRQGPRLLTEPILDKVMITGIVIQTCVLTTLHIGTYILGLYWNTGVWDGKPSDPSIDAAKGIRQARTMTILNVVFAELFRAYGARSMRSSIFEIGPFTNVQMQRSFIGSVLLTLFIALVPGVMGIFDLEYIGGREWGWIVGTMTIPTIVDEITKLVYRRTGFGFRPLVPQLELNTAAVAKLTELTGKGGAEAN